MSTTFFSASPEQLQRARIKSVWEAGDFGIIARHAEGAAVEFAARLSLPPQGRLLDVCCGTGNVGIAAARLGWQVDGIDLAASLVAQAVQRAAAEGLKAGFCEGDAEAMPYPDATYDCVASMFGVMFAARPDRAISEILRVCRPGGTIALANWAPDGLVGENTRILLKHMPPQPGVMSPLLWGDEDVMRVRLRDRLEGLVFARRTAVLTYNFPPGRLVDFLRQFHGPTLRAFGALSPEAQQQLHRDLGELFSRWNTGGPGSTRLAAEYLEVRGVRT